MKYAWVALLIVSMMFLVNCRDVKTSSPKEPVPKPKENSVEAYMKETQEFMNRFQDGDYVGAFSSIENTEAKVWNFTQPVAFVGRNPREYFGDKLQDEHICDAEIAKKLQSNPIGKIVEEAKKHRIVIVNEAHDQARDRAFIAKIAQALRPEGFSIYAAETFATRDVSVDAWQAEIMQRGYPINHDGYYIREPMFGQLVRTVLELGYKPVAYESRLPYDKSISRAERIKRRELEQTKNLIENALDKYPDEKILIHVGYSHAREKEDRRGNLWMAHFLKEQTGEDPLTISQIQTRYSCQLSKDQTKNGLDYRYFIPDPKNKDETMPYEGFDLVLYPGETQFTKSRPNWLLGTGRKFVDIPAHMKLDDKWAYIEARLAHEPPIIPPIDVLGKPARAIAVDGILKRPGEDVALALKAGDYIVTAYGAKRKTLSTANITVD